MPTKKQDTTPKRGQRLNGLALECWLQMGMKEGQKRKQQSKAPAEPRDSHWHSEVRGSHKTGKLDLDK